MSDDKIANIEEAANRMNAGAPPQQPQMQYFAVPIPLMKQVIDLIDENVNGKLGRPVTNALEQCQIGSVNQQAQPE